MIKNVDDINGNVKVITLDNDKKVILVDINDEFEFYKARSPDNIERYKKTVINMTPTELNIFREEILKQNTW